jgi:tripartite-type tricarboxylate transporter receptor subunit TctC
MWKTSMRSIRFARILFASLACGALAAALMDAASAQGDVTGYPSKPIRIIVGFAAGGGNDLVARIVGPKLSETVGQPVIVENRPGAAGQLAVVYAQSQPADGYTMVVGATGQLAIAAAIHSNLPFHPTKTLEPLTLLASYWLVIAGSTQHEIHSLNDLVAFAKANPEKANYPSSSPAFTIPAELFKLKTGMPGQTIPYKSTSEMLLSIAAGQTLFGFADPPIAIPLVQGGKIRALAMTGPSRLPELPDVPTVAESGFGNIDIRLQWIGAFAAAGTPPAIVRKLEAAVRQVLVDPAVRDRLRTVAYTPDGRPGEEFRQLIDADIRAYSEVVKAANLSFD